MTKHIISEKDLTDALCNDFSIQTSPHGKDFLILICEDKIRSSNLMNILRTNAFDLKIFIDEKMGNYSFEFHFLDSDLVFRFDTGKNEGHYPPLKKLKSDNIKYITTGIWLGRTEKGRACEYDPKFMRLGLLDIGDSFKQANGVQFVPGTLNNEPSAVVLTYQDYDHIYETEADEAYNRLIDLAKGHPHLEINKVNAEKVNLRIWDILVDLDIVFEGLAYSEVQLRDFIQNTKENHSFAFALGFIATAGEKVAMASTKREGFELVTLYGFTYKD